MHAFGCVRAQKGYTKTVCHVRRVAGHQSTLQNHLECAKWHGSVSTLSMDMDETHCTHHDHLGHNIGGQDVCRRGKEFYAAWARNVTVLRQLHPGELEKNSSLHISNKKKHYQNTVSRPSSLHGAASLSSQPDALPFPLRLWHVPQAPDIPLFHPSPLPVCSPPLQAQRAAGPQLDRLDHTTLIQVQS